MLSPKENINPERYIGVERFAEEQEIDEAGRIRLEGLRNFLDEHTANRLQFKLQHNTKYGFGEKRSTSSYFTLENGMVTIESALITDEGVGLDHRYLRKYTDYLQRKERTTVLSGHLSEIQFDPHQPFMRIALFDIADQHHEFNPSSTEYPIIATLLKNGIMPIGRDGFPVRISDEPNSIDK